MARVQEFYKGRRKARNYALIPFVIVIAVISFLLVSFYSLQQYAVISDEDEVSIELPILRDDSRYTIDSEGNEIIVFDRVETQLVFEEPDYSSVKATTGRYVEGLKAIFIPAEDINEEKIGEYARRLSRGNALVLEMKPRTGQLMWNSNAALALNYGIGAQMGQSEMLSRVISQLKEQTKDKNITFVAQISCFVDNILPSRSTTVALRTELGYNYVDDTGSWLDPYNTEVRNYIIQMIRELWDLGFDEVVLADVMHPVPPAAQEGAGQTQVKFMYTREMSTTPSPINAICGFAVSLANTLSNEKAGRLSIYCNSRTALARPDTENGQDAQLFMKLYDRVYFPTDTYTYTYNLQDMENRVEIGDIHARLVPVLTKYIFNENNDNASWVLVDN